jgi:O-antigen/teichoic acid export membrane protein
MKRVKLLLRDRETLTAAGLAGALIAQNILALLFTILAARLLGATDYGSLAALISTFLILTVPGSAIQVATARETALGRLGSGHRLAATLRRWLGRLALAALAVTVVSILLREPLAALIGVDEEWAAAATLPTGAVWLMLCVERGALQGVGSYHAVGLSMLLEAVGRVVLGIGLVLVGLDVTGAFIGAPLAMVVTAVVLGWVLHRRLGHPQGSEARTLRGLAGATWAPIAGLTLIAVLQNIDVIVVKHQIGGDVAGSYAAAAVAAKLVIWVAIGIGLYVLPEATKRAADGQDPRTVLTRALGVLAVVAIPMLLVYAAAPRLILEIGFGPKLLDAADTLAILGAAMSLLAAAYLAVQYLLALGRYAFLGALAVAAVLEPVALFAADWNVEEFALIVLIAQMAAAGVVVTLALRTRQARADRLERPVLEEPVIAVGPPEAVGVGGETER